MAGSITHRITADALHCADEECRKPIPSEPEKKGSGDITVLVRYMDDMRELVYVSLYFCCIGCLWRFKGRLEKPFSYDCLVKTTANIVRDSKA